MRYFLYNCVFRRVISVLAAVQRAAQRAELISATNAIALAPVRTHTQWRRPVLTEKCQLRTLITSLKTFVRDCTLTSCILLLFLVRASDVSVLANISVFVPHLSSFHGTEAFHSSWLPAFQKSAFHSPKLARTHWSAAISSLHELK